MNFLVDLKYNDDKIFNKYTLFQQNHYRFFFNINEDLSRIILVQSLFLRFN